FMEHLKRALQVREDNGSILNVTQLSHGEILDLIIGYFEKTDNFPRINIKLEERSRSINDRFHQNKLSQEKRKPNAYQKELYKFEKMLDEYYVKFNAEPLDL